MVQSLNALRLIIPDLPRFALEVNARGTICTIQWPCGCVARGPNDTGLSITCCSGHARAEQEATFRSRS